MHWDAYHLMDAMLCRVDWEEAYVLDVGSRDINGSYRNLIIQRRWSYCGIDIVAGDNVDRVVDHAYQYPFEDAQFDVVISGSVMEHVEAIWRWIPELVRILRPGGLLAITTHWQWEEHCHPLDCWRIMPDGMHFLFDETEALKDYQIIKADDGTLVASAFKRTD